MIFHYTSLFTFGSETTALMYSCKINEWRIRDHKFHLLETRAHAGSHSTSLETKKKKKHRTR